MVSTVYQLIIDHLMTVLGVALGILLIGRVLRSSSRPGVSYAWLMAILFIPYVGVPAFLVFGGRKIKRLAKQKSVIHSLAREPIPNHPSLLASTVDNVICSSGMAPARGNLHLEIITSGEETYQRLCEIIRGAEKSILMMTFILGRDPVGRQIVDLLAEKAREGIEVRLLLDALGCIKTRGRFVQNLRDAGGKIGIFLPVLPVRRKWSANLRNHRKIIVVDGETAMLGGMNLADEYMGPEPIPERWVDTQALVKGPAVVDLMDIFCSDWEFATGEELHSSQYIAVERRQYGNAVAQVVESGPNIKGDPIYEAVLTATYEVSDRAWIVTPYFVPDDGLMRALRMKARMGVDVRIVVPAVSNHFFADLARGRFLRDLQEAGAKIYYYHGRMVHAKHFVFDSRITVVGSLNFDMRSMYYNYEVAMFVYSTPEVEATAAWIEKIMAQCNEMPRKHAGNLRLVAEDLSFLVSPLL